MKDKQQKTAACVFIKGRY